MEDGECRARVIISGVKPEVENGRFPAKRVIGEKVMVEADIFTDGHDSLTAILLYRKEGDVKWDEAPMEFITNDRWKGSFLVTELGHYLYTVTAWVDRFKSWRKDFQKRVEAGQEDVNINLPVGANLIVKTSGQASKADSQTMQEWVKCPGIALFNAVKAALGDVQMIAEDLGIITPEVDNLREQLGFPGMRILQMAFGSDPKASEYRPHNHIVNCAVYTAIHDHNTTVGWFTTEPGTQTTQTRKEVEEERDHALKYLGTDGSEIHWDFIRLALSSVARIAIFPLQDVLGLGTEARMNLPGTNQGNWEWRFTADILTPIVRERLRELTSVYERTLG